MAEISGPGLAIAAAGGVLIWSGIQNRTLVESLRSLALGQPVKAGPQNVAQVGASIAGGAAAGAGAAVAGSARGGSIVALAATYKGTPYVFGGGHGSKPCARAMDCSGYVSCVLSRLGLLRGGPLTTEGLARWGVGVPFAQRAPGDVLVWRGGPGGGHTGIVINGTTMWHNPCTGCGGVQIGRYGTTRSGRPTLVRRASGG
ncbi:NlpC/P60 family protein [Planomonospora sp. ID82291]|uniref:NlpC/P60 family protein n=1 Tax=Planomonospora sp. ID82291 TaxID=2738136 RepID=UPI0018C40FC0|nr:NlpC/P60 family protein [Planomonospora sp. ID82291]MBG0819140.1 C40 family peptidase [Planomonospora sp. ID82291]